MNLNNKGFTLVELLAVVVILSILLAFMYPNVNKLINENKEKNYEKLESSIKSAAKMYISDYRYKITVDGENITSINDSLITDSKVPVSILVDEGNIETNDEGKIENPRNKKECLNFDNSYVTVKYDSTKKDYNYSEPNLEWKSC